MVYADDRDYIKQHGINFEKDKDFDDRMDAQGTHSVHIHNAVLDNLGAHPKLADYFGTFDLRGPPRTRKPRWVA